MKNYLKTGLLLILTIFLTGCVNVETNMDITMNKKMYFTIKMTIDKSNLEGDDIYKEELLDKNQKEELINEGFEIEKYTDDNYIGNIISKKFNNIDYLSSSEDIDYNLKSVLEDPLSTAYIFKIEKGFFKNKYYAKYDLSTIDLFYIYDISNFDFKITLPTKALKNNATSIEDEGRELTWNMENISNPIEVEFELYNTINVVAIGLVFLIIVLIILYIIFTIIGKKDKNKKIKTPKKHKDHDDDNYHPRFIIPEQTKENDDDL